MRNNKTWWPHFLKTIQLTGRGRFYWRLWTPILIGIAVGLLNGLLTEISNDFMIEISQNTLDDLKNSYIFGAHLLLRGAAIATLFVFSSWWSTDSTRSRMLVDGSLTNYLLLPFSLHEKTIYLILRTPVLPFLTMYAVAIVIQAIAFSAALIPTLRMFPLAAGISICLGALGWSGSWSHVREKVFGENISFRSQNGVGLLTLLLLISLPLASLTDGYILVLLSTLPYIICFLWLKSQNGILQIEGCIDSTSRNYHDRKKLFNNAQKNTFILNRILATKPGKSRPGRWLLLNSFNSDSLLKLVDNQSWRQIIAYSVLKSTLYGLGILVWIFLYFRNQTLTSEIIGLNIMLMLTVTIIAETYLKQSLSQGLPLRCSDRSVERVVSLSLNPVFSIPLIAIFPVTAIMLITSVQAVFGWDIFEVQKGWLSLTAGSSLSALQLLPAGVAWIAFLNSLLTAAALICNRLGFFRAAKICSSSFEIHTFATIAPLVIFLESSAILIEADKLLLLLLAVAAITLYLTIGHVGDKKLQRAFP